MRIYNYKQRGTWIVALVVTLCCGGLIVGTIWAAATGTLLFNDRPASAGESLFSVIFVLATGGLFIYLSVHGFMRALNERIEFSDDQVRWYDSRGRLRVQCAQTAVKSVVRKPLHVNELYRYEVETDGGQIRFINYIRDCEGLEARFRQLAYPDKGAGVLPRH